ncbi:zinc transporter ZIP10-like [Heterodontus francisci]|uniref:zinc transporter ZIP10-like n=1 Tax=Heterodontus francisci TaxID=7792 RepID=UPI00355B8A76
MKCGIWTVFLIGLLAVWMDHGHHCKAHSEAHRVRTRHNHKHNEFLEAESDAVPTNRPVGRRGTVSHALSEQRYYLLQLFRHYGENGKLSFDGLHKLLMNLGLGEVQVVEIEHEDLGHNHVLHLDVLDLQEKKHMHSHTTTDHISMLTKDSEHSLGPHHPEFPSGSSTTVSTSRSPKRTGGKTTLSTSGRRDAPRDPWVGSQGGERLRRRSAAEHYGELPKGRHHTTKSRSAAATEKVLSHSKYNHLHGNCLNVSQLLVNFGMSDMHEITPKQFTYICPALLYQIDSRVCIQHLDWLEVQKEDALSKSVWVCGFVAITLISLTSLMAVAIIPCLSRSFSKVLLTFLVALAIGTLSADALLHLIPHSQDNQDHRHKNSENAAGKDSIWKGLSALGGIYLLYLIENLLNLFRNCSRGRSTDRRRHHLYKEKELTSLQVDDRDNLELSHLKPAQGSDDHTHREDKWEVTLSGFEHTEFSSTHEQDQEEAAVASWGPCTQQTTNKTDEHPESDQSKDSRSGKWVSGEQGCSHGHSHAVEDIKHAGIANIAWMVIMGDGVHNFTDGLAIGAAFSTGIPGGLSTTLAVFCHELPHELGDFAVLVQAGMRVRQAVTFNLVSALISYLGMVIGIAVGQYTNNVTPWIFAGTAGMFLYIALVDMLPEMLHGRSDTKHPGYLGHFMGQNLGFLLGVGTMLCIALFEDQIIINISF